VEVEVEVEVEEEEEVKEKVEVEVELEVWRRRRRRRSRKGGIKWALENSSTNSCGVSTSTYLPPPFLRYMPTDHGVRFCSSPKSQLRVRITPQYFTGILILCMTTTYVLFMSHRHVL
jgi:hypothetical protein